MKNMFRAIDRFLKRERGSKLFQRERGFTLVEMVTVVAIMGVMAAVAVPMVNNQLGKTRATSYLQDQAMIQTAVDSFFTAADNVRHLGQRQFPIASSGISSGNSTIPDGTDQVAFDETVSTAVITSPVNPRKGTQGGEPKWRDGDADGNRILDSDGIPIPVDHAILNGSEEALNNANPAFNNQVENGGWYVDNVTFQGSPFSVDSRNYFIDFRLLVDAGLLQNVPQSASPDNGGGTIDGSYSWYVKSTGSVSSLLYFLPSNGDQFPVVESDGSITFGDDGTVDTRGFQDGVYP